MTPKECCEAVVLFHVKNRKQQNKEEQDKSKRIQKTRRSDRVHSLHH